MLVLGIILVLVATAVVLAALVGGAGQSAVFDLGAVDVQTSAFGAFLTGAGTVVVLVLGIGLIQIGLRRARRRRQDKKELNRLAKKVESQESATPATATGSSSTDTSTADTRVDETRTDTHVTDRDRPTS